jgi:tRNA A-37 threonylcarbamoyl transferase component Bud32
MTSRPSSAEADYVALARLAGVRARVEGAWARVGRTSRVQGWKLHVSSIPVEAPALLRRVVPLLVDCHVSFKFMPDAVSLGVLNEGGLGDLQVGKFITIYPRSDAQARELAGELVRETARHHGPIVATDLRLGSVVYARYGSFRPVLRRDRLGQVFPAIHDGYGALCRDDYTVPFAPPPGVVSPFGGLRGGVEPVAEAGGARLFGPGYLILDVLKTNPKGSVFLALDLRSQADAAVRVLKQGRQYCLSDELGRDIRTRLRHQAALGAALRGIVATPAPGEYFDVNGHGYLPLDHIDGVTLLHALTTVSHDLAWNGVDAAGRGRALRLLAGAAECVAAMHTAGVVHRDLSPTNLLVGDGDEMYVLDLELAHALDDPAPPFGKGTPGFMSPEQRAGETPDPAQDVYALGCLVSLALCGMDPRWIAAGEPEDIARRVRVLSGGAHPVLRDLTVACLSPVAAKRPTAVEVAAVLAEAPVATDPRVRVRTAARVARGRTLGATVHKGYLGLVLGALRDPGTGLWLSAMGEADQSTGGHRSFELRADAHHGVAGVVYALARLVRLGYADAAEVAAELAPTIAWVSGRPDPESLPGLYFGDAGVAVALAEAGSSGIAVDEQAVRTLMSSAIAAPLDWLDLTHGAAGQAVAAMLCRSYCADASTQVERIAAYLVDRQESDGSWRAQPGVDGLSGQILTGFAHGCAGIVYALALCTRLSSVSTVEESWRRGADWLAAAARERPGDVLEWRYSDQAAEPWAWWCHGGPGIALAFLELFRLTGEGRYADVAEKALRVHGVDVRATNLSTCHGLSGLGEIYLDAAAVLGRPSWRRRAEAVADTLVALARPTPAGQVTWLVEDPHVTTADLMVGTAGVLHFLARLHSGDGSLGFPLLAPASMAG